MIPFWHEYNNIDFKHYCVMLKLPILSDGYCIDSAVPIDYSISGLIQKLNDKGFHTQFCCSGLESEHCGNFLSSPFPL